jgi:hypothetical protein
LRKISYIQIPQGPEENYYYRQQKQKKGGFVLGFCNPCSSTEHGTQAPGALLHAGLGLPEHFKIIVLYLRFFCK